MAELGIVDEAALVGTTLRTTYRRIVSDQSYLTCLASPSWIRVLPICTRRSPRHAKGLVTVRAKLDRLGNPTSVAVLRPGDWPQDEWPVDDVRVLYGPGVPSHPPYRPTAIPTSWTFTRSPAQSPSLQSTQPRLVIAHGTSGDSGVIYLLVEDGDDLDGAATAVLDIPEHWRRVADGFTGRQLISTS